MQQKILTLKVKLIYRIMFRDLLESLWYIIYVLILRANTGGWGGRGGGGAPDHRTTGALTEG